MSQCEVCGLYYSAGLVANTLIFGVTVFSCQVCLQGAHPRAVSYVIGLGDANVPQPKENR